MVVYKSGIIALLTIMIWVSGGISYGEANQNTTEIMQGQTIVSPLKYGDRGEQVVALQKQLNAIGYSVGAADGVFGSMTRDAIVQFQLERGVTVDGVATLETLRMISRAEQPSRQVRSIAMSASGYSAYDPGNSHYTALGMWLQKGIVAVDPRVIPLGTRLYIPGYGHAVAGDTGGAIIGNRIDLAFDSHSAALHFGRREVIVYIL